MRSGSQLPPRDPFLLGTPGSLLLVPAVRAQCPPGLAEGHALCSALHGARLGPVGVCHSEPVGEGAAGDFTVAVSCALREKRERCSGASSFVSSAGPPESPC